MSNGLRNSARFVVDMLLREGIRAKLVDAVDGNSIDRLVHENKPTRVILEAIWATPKKMAELMRLHPRVLWTVRVHSETTFLANEGMAMSWIMQYLDMGIEVAFNSEDTANDFKALFPGRRVFYLPNYYPLRKPRSRKQPNGVLDVACFGAVRPLKNQLIQAMASILYAGKRDLPLRFHMNGSRTENDGANNLKNIRALLGDQLIIHPWMDHEDFLETICQMDMLLQVSLTESFNVVSSDAISMGVPVVGSNAIKWLPERSQAPVDSAVGIAKAMQKADDTSVQMNHDALTRYLRHAVTLWVDFVI